VAADLIIKTRTAILKQHLTARLGGNITISYAKDFRPQSDWTEVTETIDAVDSRKATTTSN